MPEKKHIANIKDVASVAKVSTATVSRYLNGNLNRMSSKTAERVKVAIEKLEYVPNSAARQMITKSSKMIALIVANTDDYFSTEVFKGVSSILESYGYIGMMLDSDSDIVRERKLMSVVNSNTFDGLIIQPFNSMGSIEESIHRNIPIVIVDREMDQAPWVQVITNNYEVSREAASYFMKQGFTRFIVLTSKLSAATNRRERYRGIESVAKNIEVLEVSESLYNHKEIYDNLVKLLTESKERTVIFALKERWLLEFVPNLILKGYIDNVKATATGFADTTMARQIEPKMKLISQDPFLMGAGCAEIMVKRLKGEVQKENVIVVPATFH